MLSTRTSEVNLRVKGREEGGLMIENEFDLDIARKGLVVSEAKFPIMTCVLF